MDNFLRYREPHSATFTSPVAKKSSLSKLPYMSSLSSNAKKVPTSGLDEAFGTKAEPDTEKKKSNIDGDEIMNFIGGEEDRPIR